jgi:hypothetical protein
MADAPGPEDPPAAARQSPKEMGVDIHLMAAEIWRRVEEWRNSPRWRDTEQNRSRYDDTARVIAALADVPDPVDQESLRTLIETVRPLMAVWRPNYAGPEQAIYAMVDRLRYALVDFDGQGRWTIERP